MTCHTSTAGVEPTITQVEYHRKRRNGTVPFLPRANEAIEWAAGFSFRFVGAADQQLICSGSPFVLYSFGPVVFLIFVDDLKMLAPVPELGVRPPRLINYRGSF